MQAGAQAQPPAEQEIVRLSLRQFDLMLANREPEFLECPDETMARKWARLNHWEPVTAESVDARPRVVRWGVASVEALRRYRRERAATQ